MSGTRGKFIANTAHLLVVERFNHLYNNIYYMCYN